MPPTTNPDPLSRRCSQTLINLITCWVLFTTPFLNTTSAQNNNTDQYTEIRGMTISCRRSGQAWASDAMVDSMRELKKMGINWIAIHPYAQIQSDGSVISWSLEGRTEPPDWIARPIREAHKLGLKIMIKPHLAYWGSPFQWRGDISFTTDDQWDNFFNTYDDWITQLAHYSKDADAFVVGTELDKTIQHEKQWRNIITSVRSQFKGPITYAANWSDYDKIPFWDALDVIGIQAYFPILTEKPSDKNTIPSAEQLDEGWQRIMKKLRAFSEKNNRKIIFTELGYNQSVNAPYEPWDHKQDGPEAIEIQTRCLNSALKAIKNEPTVNGAFLWKWFPGNTQYGNFTMADPAVRKIIIRNWLRK